MARLLVQACTAEGGADIVFNVLVGVSVSRVDNGAPVTGLKHENFRVASITFGSVQDFTVGARESMWEPGDVELSGCYELNISLVGGQRFFQGTRYVWGIQARTFTGTPPRVVELISLGT
jgi:hypothetical protein